jgi:hypothetical protein
MLKIYILWTDVLNKFVDAHKVHILSNAPSMLYYEFCLRLFEFLRTRGYIRAVWANIKFDGQIFSQITIKKFNLIPFNNFINRTCDRQTGRDELPIIRPLCTKDPWKYTAEGTEIVLTMPVPFLCSYPHASGSRVNTATRDYRYFFLTKRNGEGNTGHFLHEKIPF